MFVTLFLVCKWMGQGGDLEPGFCEFIYVLFSWKSENTIFFPWNQTVNAGEGTIVGC